MITNSSAVGLRLGLGVLLRGAAHPGRRHGGVEHRGVLVAVNEAGASLLLQMVASSAVVVPQFKTHQASELSSASIELANNAAGAFVLNVVS